MSHEPEIIEAAIASQGQEQYQLKSFSWHSLSFKAYGS